MILIDLQGTMIAAMMSEGLNKSLNVHLLKHMIYNTLRSYKRKFAQEYGPEIVICCDSRSSWRREYFPYYKQHRKKDREASGLDWNLIFRTFDEVVDGLKEHFPYKVIKINGVEADDIIGVITNKASIWEIPILIISSDKDFLQLQKFTNVFQFSPGKKEMICINDPVSYLKEHIINGDKGDGIPNILSADDTFVTGKRQGVMSANRLKTYMETNMYVGAASHGYARNEILIDLDKTPEKFKTLILEEYNKPIKQKNNKEIMDFFISERLSSLVEAIDEF